MLSRVQRRWAIRMITATHQTGLLHHCLQCHPPILHRNYLRHLRRHVCKVVSLSCALVVQARHRPQSILRPYLQPGHGKVQSNGSSLQQRDGQGSRALPPIGLGHRQDPERPKRAQSNSQSHRLAINPPTPYRTPIVLATTAAHHDHPNLLVKSKIKSRSSSRRSSTHSTSPPVEQSQGMTTSASITPCATCCTTKSQPRTVSTPPPWRNSSHQQGRKSATQCTDCRHKTFSNSNKTTRGGACTRRGKQSPTAPVIIMA